MQPAFLTQLIKVVIAGVAPLSGVTPGARERVIIATQVNADEQLQANKPNLPWCAGSRGSGEGAASHSPDTPVPTGDMAMSLGEHLSKATRDKILKGEFIDFFSLLYREVEKKDKDLMDDREKEVLRKRKVDRTWANWLSRYLIYVGVNVKAHPERGGGGCVAISQYCVQGFFLLCGRILAPV